MNCLACQDTKEIKTACAECNRGKVDCPNMNCVDGQEDCYECSGEGCADCNSDGTVDCEVCWGSCTVICNYCDGEGIYIDPCEDCEEEE